MPQRLEYFSTLASVMIAAVATSVRRSGLLHASVRELARHLGDLCLSVLPSGEERRVTMSTPTPCLPRPAALRVLVVEDNPVNQRIAARLIERRGCRVELAANGIEAVAAASWHTYDLILMDCQMPAMDGFEAARTLRQIEGMRGTHTPIVALTSLASAADRGRCLDAGMDDHIARPLTPRSLDAALRRWALPPA